ncbi:MAG: hypothetical protein ACK53Y_07885, partial [bacterium]
ILFNVDPDLNPSSSFSFNFIPKVRLGRAVCYLSLSSCVIDADYFFPHLSVVIDIGMFSPPLSTSSSNLRSLKIGYVRVG